MPPVSVPSAPLLDANAPWKRRYRLPVTYGVGIAARHPARGVAISTVSGVEHLYAWDVPSGFLTQRTFRPEGVGATGDGIPNATISPNGREIYYLDDRHGDETGHYVRVPFAGGEPADITPSLPPYVGFLLGFSLAGHQLGFTAIIDEQYHIFCIDIEREPEHGQAGSLGQPRVLYRSAQQTIGPIFSADGALVIIQTKRPGTGDYKLIALDSATGDVVSQLEDADGGLEIYLASPLPGDARMLVLANRTGCERPLLWHARTGEREELTLESVEGDVIPMDWSPDGGRLLLRQDSIVSQRLYLYDVNQRSTRELTHPGGTLGTTEPRSIYFAPDNALFALWESAMQPRQTVALDAETGALKRTMLSAEAAPEGHRWRSVTFPSSDDALVQGWLGVPHGAGPFPTILDLHGGPEFAITDVFSPSSQCWLDHGFAYLAVNYRGSTGFGSEFQSKIRGALGHWEVEDVVAARAWLVEQRVALPDQVWLTGWSYGGYLTLLTLGKQPDLWAGGMAGNAFTDLTMNDADGSSIKAYVRGLMGGTPEEKPAQYAASSPITYVERVKAPAMIIQGRNDTRSTARQIETYEACMQTLGKSIEVHWFDAGHGTRSIEQQISHQELMLRFVYRTLSQ